MTKLTTIQKDLVFGTLLGDGNLQTFSNGNSWRYRALHKNAHKEYLYHKYEILSPLCKSPPIYGEVWDERSQAVYKRDYFNTGVDTCFEHYAGLFYKFNKETGCWQKDVPLNVGKYLTAPVIAYWYMDDGALKWKGHSNAMRICTESFSEHGVNRLRKALFEKFEIVTTKTKKTRKDGSIGWRIAIPEESSTKFCLLIEPHLVDCMKYKVSDGNKGHL